MSRFPRSDVQFDSITSAMFLAFIILYCNGGLTTWRRMIQPSLYRNFRKCKMKKYSYTFLSWYWQRPNHSGSGFRLTRVLSAFVRFSRIISFYFHMSSHIETQPLLLILDRIQNGRSPLPKKFIRFLWTCSSKTVYTVVAKGNESNVCYCSVKTSQLPRTFSRDSRHEHE